MNKEERAKEFLNCLGNGKGRITYEDENPDEEEKKLEMTYSHTLKGRVS